MRRSDDDGIALFTLDAGKANAIGPAFLDALAGLTDDVRARPPRALVVTGVGRAFSAGLALPDLIDLDRSALDRFITRFDDAMAALFQLPFPVVAAVNGHAIAGGCVLAFTCDERVMRADAGTIGLNETQLGIGLPAIVLEMARAVLPASSWTTVLLRGELVDAARAHALGVVDEVIPAGDDVVAAALRRARAMAAAAGPAFAQVKRALRAPVTERAAARDRAEVAAWLDTWFSDDGQARLRATVARLGSKGRAP
jgi:enoyl-CoA hydratase